MAAPLPGLYRAAHPGQPTYRTWATDQVSAAMAACLSRLLRTSGRNYTTRSASAQPHQLRDGVSFAEGNLFARGTWSDASPGISRQSHLSGSCQLPERFRTHPSPPRRACHRTSVGDVINGVLVKDSHRNRYATVPRLDVLGCFASCASAQALARAL
jgi:hypothetical protein